MIQYFHQLLLRINKYLYSLTAAQQFNPLNRILQRQCVGYQFLKLKHSASSSFTA